MPVPPNVPAAVADDLLAAPGADTPGVPADGAEELALTTRSGFVESRHLGHAVVVDPDGEVVVAVGDPEALVNPRSSLKPIQAATCLLAGAPLAGAGLAIGAGSHHGHPDHVELVRSVLAAAGLDPDALQTPAAWPSAAWARDDLVRAGGQADPLQHNCSGKHAAMLVACVAAGWDPSTYRDLDHPLQRAIRARVEEATGVPVAHVGVDGCGAPLFTTTPRGLARAMGTVARLAHAQVGDVGRAAHAATTPLADALGRVGAAMRAHPWAVAGIGVDDTVVMQELDGVVAKGGAEGVVALGTASGHGVAVKVLDGAMRAPMPAALALLRAAGIDADPVADALASRMLGHGQEVGRVHPSALVRDRAVDAHRRN